MSPPPRQHGDLLVVTITNGPFVENCYVLCDSASERALLIDPGAEEQRILESIRALGWEVEAIVNTHAHIDHVGAVGPLKRLLGVPFALHPAETPVLASLPMQAQLFGLPPCEVPQVERTLADGDQLSIGQLHGTVLETPGHTPGGCSFHFAGEGVVFVGDTLFAGSIGRSDLPGGDGGRLLASIHTRLLTLDDEVVVYSGHGPTTTIGDERRTNPFLR